MSSLEDRVSRLEKLVLPFSEQVTPEMTARDVINLWLKTHKAVNGRCLWIEAGEKGPTAASLRQRLWSMAIEGRLIREAVGVYRRP